MEITFKADKKHRDKYFSAGSFAHPAKMMLPLQRWLIERYSKPGDVILDPMAGQGTLLIACTTGRHVIMVELETKFVQMQRDNWVKIQTLGPEMGYEMGTATILQGDAGKLSDVLADVVISSPPYTNRMDGGIRGPRAGMTPYTDESPDSWFTQRDQKNIGNLPYGKLADVIMTSPPYAETGVGDWQTGRAEFQAWVLNELATKGYIEWQGKRYTESEWRAMNHGRIDGRTTKGVHKHPTDGYGETSGQLANLPYGSIDAVITSPPYEEAMGEKHHSPRADKLAKEKSNPVTYTDKVDVILTSPPYETPMKYDGENKRRRILAGEKLGQRDDVYFSKGNIAWQGLEAGYGEAKDNIGNLKGESYLSAMLEVYQGCWRVLKPQGLMCLVTKNFIRNKQEIRLDLDTIKLCEQSGFGLIERHYRKLTSQSFWRTIYQQKYPDAPILDKEDILIFRK